MGKMKKSAYTHDQFIEKVSKVNPEIRITGTYAGVDKKIEIECTHLGKNLVYAYSLLKARNCCKQGFFENRTLHNLKTIDHRKVEIQNKFGNSTDTASAEYNQTRDKIINLKCTIHNNMFSQWISSLNKGIGCPDCGKEHKTSAGVRMLAVARKAALDKGRAKYVSKNETKWLDSLNVPVRQFWLQDVKYNVDGYDPTSNTAYLYHGRFWHGCPETFDPEMIHPILKIKMKEIYEQTLVWENKIKTAGYNLITKWGN